MHACINPMVKHRSDLSAFLLTECKMIDLKYINEEFQFGIRAGRQYGEYSLKIN